MTENGSSGRVVKPERGQIQDTFLRWGDNLNKKQKSTIRIGFNNINGFKAEINHVHNHDIRSFIAMYDFDIFGMSEINLHWRSSHHHWTECTKGWFQRLNVSTAYHKNYPTPTAFQVGGVMQFIIGTTTSRVSSVGGDALGRWTWHSLKGKNNRTIRILSAYRPVRNESNAGSVWNQQQYHADSMNSVLNPHESWISDVSTAIQKWLAEGDSIIFMFDLNNDVLSSPVARALQRLGLRELVSTTHGNSTNTHQRGSCPIDGIYVSGEIVATACGFNESPSDHLAVWVDVDIETLFGDTRQDPPHAIRRLQCSDPRTVIKYNDKLWQLIQQKNITTKVDMLADNNLNHKSKTIMWEKLDQTMVKLRLVAEQKCRKIKVGRLQWTPELARLRLVKKFWVLAYRRRSKYAVDFKFFSRIARKLNKDPRTNWEMDVIYDDIAKAKEDLVNYTKQHSNTRATWLDGLALAMAENDGRDDHDRDLRVVNYVTVLKRREEQRSSARVIRRITQGPKVFQQLDHVIFDVDGKSITTSTKDEMEDALLQENQHRFNQAKDCPFLVHPLVDIVGRYADHRAFATLTHSDLDHYSGNIYTDMVLNAFHGPPNRSDIQLDLSIRSFEQGWLKCKEHTAAGPSGLHFGHFIAACKHDQLKTLECAMGNFPLQTGYSPVRWQHGVEVMLLKQLNNFHVNKLRAILLFEADFNFNNKRIGRALMWKAEDEHWIAPEQYGSRRNFSAIDHCLNKRLSVDILRQYKQSGAICVNDMKGCYDRIVHSVASLCMQRWGMPEQPIRMMLHTLQHLKHYVRTSYGKSDRFFDAKSVHPVAIQGIGQGNGAGLQIWASISSMLLDILRNQQFGATFCAPISGRQMRLVGYAYVNDTDIITTTDKQEYQHTACHMQKGIDIWEGIIDATGGQLEPSKTYLYLIHFGWTQGKWRYLNIKDSPVQMTMRNTTQSPIQIERLEVNEARRTLGVRIAPDGNNQAEFLHLRNECNQWADRIRCGMVPRKYAWQAFSSTIWSKISYALPATTFTQDQCNEITKKLVASTLSTSGINQHLPRDLVFGHKDKQGLGFPDLYVWQGAEAVNRFMHFITMEGHISANLMEASYELLVLETGLDQPLLASFAKWKVCATKCYLTHLWEFIDNFNIQIKGPSLLGQGQREQDSLIMETLDESLSAAQLGSVNRCRVYLQVIWWSDIIDGNGVAISENAIKGKREPCLNNKWKWPNQEKPTSQDWDIWVMAISKGTFRSRRGKVELQQPLGKWLKGDHMWYYDQGTERLLHGPTNIVWTRVPGRPTRQAHLRFHQSHITDDDFPRTTVATIIRTSTLAICIEGSFPVQSELNNRVSSFMDFLRSNKSWNWIQNVSVTDEAVFSIATDIQENEGIVVSDGSFKDSSGTAALVIERKNTSSRILADVVVPGESIHQCSF
jgi:hypothetical protein